VAAGTAQDFAGLKLAIWQNRDMSEPRPASTLPQALVTGATGLLGRALLGRLGQAVVVSREPARARARMPGIVDAYPWAGADQPFPAEALHGVRTIFHLAGESVADGRWTADKKRRIRESRVLGTRALVGALAVTQPRPEVLISASAVGVYGDRGDEELDESSSPGGGFLADVCREWEAEALTAQALGMRVACVRFGVVLAAHGGALARMLPAFRLGLGGRLGHGRQWLSFIHLDDAVGMLLQASRDPAYGSAVNAVAPQPVTNRDFARALGQALRRPAILPVPAAGLRLALGEMSQVLTSSQRVFPRVALRARYPFAHPELAEALASLLHSLG
jgi:uncharacterized protein